MQTKNEELPASALEEALQYILLCKTDEARICASRLSQEKTRNILLQLCQAHEELNRYVGEIAGGNLDAARPSRNNFLAMGIKNLHSKLSHMAWQIGQIAQGDYSQKLDYMGTLTECFNQMTLQLRQRREADETIRRMYDKLTKSDEVIKMLQERERERDEALDLAMQASKAKGKFLANMSHEMLTPLNAVLGMAAVGKNESTLTQKDEAFKIIEASSSHLLSIINDLLDMTKLDGGWLVLTSAPFNFQAMLEKVLDTIAYDIKNKSQTLDTIIDEAIPENLEGDSQRLAQIIANLLDNAAKFTPEKGAIQLEVRLHAQENGVCTLQFTVSDNGIGIPAERQAQLFDPFEQVEGDFSRKYGGTGLGLAISSRIIEMMGGEIHVDSSPGQGSKFTFTARLLLDKAASAAAAESETKDDFSAFRILLVDDVEINREIVTTLLEPTGLKIDCATNGQEAIDMFREAPTRYHLIFMDLQMPEVDGLEATQKIRALGLPESATVPVIAMTANAFEEDVENCLAVGMNSHLSKPLDMKAVMDTLRNYLPTDKKSNKS